jgi:hypothetical protein
MFHRQLRFCPTDRLAQEMAEAAAGEGETLSLASAGRKRPGRNRFASRVGDHPSRVADGVSHRPTRICVRSRTWKIQSL